MPCNTASEVRILSLSANYRGMQYTLKYITTAVALRCFSYSSFTRGLYRRLGNSIGNKRRSSGTMPGYYPERVKRIVQLQRRYKIIKDGDRILELGTGWLHWEAITLRLFYDIKAVLFDVWDNRQLGGLKNYIRQLRDMLGSGFELSAGELKRARGLIQQIVEVESFIDLYNLLGFEYAIQSSGSLKQFSSGSFQLVVSGGVLEHVKRAALPTLIRETERVLKPGGWAVHSIDTADHLEHYDRSVSPKLYLTFSDETWIRRFENEVQYINRMQRGEWLDLFCSAGFELTDEETHRIDISALRLADRYRFMERSDLECTVLKVALRKQATS
jgi:SAM-dependent methyltransferase